MKLLLNIALSYLKVRKRQTIVSLIGVVLGVAFFIAVASLMRGSDKDFIKRMVDTFPHITVLDEYRSPSLQPAEQAFPNAAVLVRGVKPKEENRGIANYREIVDFVNNKEGLQIGEVMSGPAIINYRGTDYSISVNGIKPEDIAKVTTISDYIIQGSIQSLKADSNGILLGKSFINRAGLKLGDSIIITPSNNSPRSFKIVGVFETGSARTDKSTAYINLTKAQTLFNKPNRISSLIIKMDNPFIAADFATELENMFAYKSESWQEVSEDIMRTLAIRNGVMYSVVSAILIVASLGIYNVIYTIVMEKAKDIAIMKSIGFSPKDVSLIFIFQGFILGIMGSLLGCAVGRGLLEALSSFKMKLPGSAKPAPFPLDYSIDQYIFAVSVATLAAVIAAMIPSRKAGALPPVEILRGAV